MSAPILWIILPALAGVILYFLRRWYRIVVLAGTVIATILAGLAWRMPINQTVSFGPWSFKLADTLLVLGRRFVVEDSLRPILVMIYAFAAFWLGAAYIAEAGRAFVPLSLLIVAFLTAALAVRPFLYAALLIEMAVLVCVPILSRPGRPLQKGVLRFFTLQTLGMPFILFTGWMLAGVETAPGDLQMVAHASILLGFGFVLWMAIFPFHTWIPMLSQDAHPFVASFVFVLIPWMIGLFGLGFLEGYTWLRSTPQVADLLRLAGVLMAITAGVWAAVERHLGRLLGYAVMAEIGFSLLAISLPGGLPMFFEMFLPRALSLGVWALALSVIRSRTPQLRFQEVQGLARSMPVAAGALLLAQFSLTGMPLLAGFPVKLSLWESLAEYSKVAAYLSLIGSMGIFASGLRTFSVLAMGEDNQEWRVTESWQIILFLGIGVLGLLLVGLFPQVFLPPLAAGIRAFPHLIP